MAFQNFAAKQQVKVIETGELVQAGGITTGKSQDLQNIVLGVYKQGPHAGTEKLRLKLFSDKAMTKLYATSAWSAVASIPGIGTNWIGWLRFDFSGDHLNGLLTYWVGVEAAGYTRNGDTFYLSLLRDWGIGQSGNPAALAMAIYGQRWVG